MHYFRLNHENPLRTPPQIAVLFGQREVVIGASYFELFKITHQAIKIIHRPLHSNSTIYQF
jgi:hypothetical protein